eukprot:11178677-Lingulodinium_polyedra.AAC.1
MHRASKSILPNACLQLSPRRHFVGPAPIVRARPEGILDGFSGFPKEFWGFSMGFSKGSQGVADG